jgi:hypothetical protein
MEGGCKTFLRQALKEILSLIILHTILHRAKKDVSLNAIANLK